MELSGGVEHTGILTRRVRLGKDLFHYWDIVLYLKQNNCYKTRTICDEDACLIRVSSPKRLTFRISLRTE